MSELLAPASMTLAEIRTELEELYSAVGEGDMSRRQRSRWNALLREAEVRCAKRDLDRANDEQRSRVASMAGNANAVETANSAPPRPAYRSTPYRGLDPWRDGGETNRHGMPLLDRESIAQLRGRALSCVERMSDLPPAAVERSTQLLESADTQGLEPLARWTIASSDPAYLRAFTSWFVDPVAGHMEWDAEERAAVKNVRALSRALVLGTAASGGNLVAPYQLDPQILISNAGMVNPVRQICRVETTILNEARFVTSLGSTASWDAESEQVSDDSPVFEQPAITAFKGQAFIPVTHELLEDSPNLPAQIGNVFLEAKTSLESTAFTVGTGSGQPTGYVTALTGSAASGTVVVGTSSTGYVADDLVALQNSLSPRWCTAGPRWAMNLATLNGFRGVIRETGLTSSIVDDSGPVPRILGWPAHEVSDMDDTITSGGEHDYLIAVGDWRQYIVVDRLSSSIEHIPQLFGVNQRPVGQRGFLIHWRTGADLVVDDAFRLLDYTA